MVEKINVSLDNWILSQCVGTTKNRSSRIKELIIKGWHMEQMQKAKEQAKAFYRILARKPQEVMV